MVELFNPNIQVEVYERPTKEQTNHSYSEQEFNARTVIMKLAREYHTVKNDYKELCDRFYLYTGEAVGEYTTASIILKFDPTRKCTSPETICRVFRSLVEEGIIKQNTETIIRREQSSKEIREFYKKR
jgi:DNA-binding transcriptional regulator YhcF (GntR family)